MTGERETLGYFLGRVEQVRHAVEKAVEEAGAYGSDRLVEDLDWTRYVPDHVHAIRDGDTDYVDDDAARTRLDELWERYRLHHAR